MDRRLFLAGLVAVPVVGQLAAMERPIPDYRSEKCWGILEYADWRNRQDYKAIGSEMARVFSKEDLTDAEVFYWERLGELETALNDHSERITGNRHTYYKVSDDGFWDLRSQIVGLGRAFYHDVMFNPEIAKRMVEERAVVENFGYVFHYTKHRPLGQVSEAISEVRRKAKG